MNNNTSVATSGVAVDLTVNIDAVVALYVSRREEELYSQQANKKAEVFELSKQMGVINDSVLDDAYNKAVFTTEGSSVSNDFVGIKFNVNKKEFNTNFTNKLVYGTVTMVTTKKLAESNSYDNGETKTTIPVKYDISEVEVTRYSTLLTEKTELLREISVINEEIRNISRNERKVRAKLAERALTEGGLSHLVNDPTLLLSFDK